MILLLSTNFILPWTQNPIYRVRTFITFFIALCVFQTCALFANQKNKKRTLSPKTLTLAQLSVHTLLPHTSPKDTTEHKTLSLSQFFQKKHNKNYRGETLITIPHPDRDPTLTRIVPGISSDDTLQERVTLYSRGFWAWATSVATFINGETHPTGGIINAYDRMRYHTIQGPCVTFDRPERRGVFTFGQQFELKCFDTVYRALQTRYPNARITLFSDCLGSLVSLRFIAQNPEITESIDNIILESPLSSTRDFFDRTPTAIREFVYDKVGIPLSESIMRSILQSGTCWWYYRFKRQLDTLNTDAIRGKNIFAVHLLGDFLISDSSVTKLVKKLRIHNTVYFVPLTEQDFTDKVPLHCRLSPSQTFQKAVNAFYRAHGLPHDETLAAEGERYLQTALLAQ